MNHHTSAYSGPDARRIRGMFASIAGGYDRANTVLSGGIHHRWRKAIVSWSGAKRGDRVLDCATGTGDLAIAFADVVGTEGHVVGTDFCPEMLAFAPEKARRRGRRIEFGVADVMRLPYESASFEISSIAFGIRNVEDPQRALSELARVVRPGGRVVVLEFGQPSGLFGSLFRFYAKRVLPLVGGMLTGHPEAYDYLERSAGAFPCRGDFLDLMRSTGMFESVEFRPLTMGIAFAYCGVRK